MYRKAVLSAVGVSVGAILWGVCTGNGLLVSWALPALLALGWIANRMQVARTPSAQGTVRIDAEGVRSGHDHLTWAELVRIRIVTTDEGPFVDDLFWVFEAAHGGGCVVPGSQVTSDLFDWLGKLPGIDFGAVIQAQGSVQHAQFLVWSGEPGRALQQSGAA